MSDNKNSKNENLREDVILGRNPVMEAIKSGRAIDTILISGGDKKGSINSIISNARKNSITIKEVDDKRLDFLSNDGIHQGIIALAAVKEYSKIDDIFNLAESRNEKPFIIILDEIEDPHNLGAIIRSAECAGAHGVIIPKRRSAGLSYTVGRASAGAVEHMHVVRVTNITDTIKTLKEKNVWVYGADMKGEDYLKCNFEGSIALVIGNEGKGIGRLVSENCDVLVSMPIKGEIDSLNASVAAGILMYKVLEFR